jgi:DUF917 family protein
MALTLTTKQDVEDFVYGLTLLATGGGGGKIDDGVEVLTRELIAKGRIEIPDIDELPDDLWTVTTIVLSGRDPETPPAPEELAQFGLTRVVHGPTDYTVAAVRELEQYAGVNVGAVISAELGSSNTAEPIATASRLGVPIVDGDYVGRAIPEVQMMKPEIFGCSFAPAAFVDRWGNTLILKENSSTAMADRIGRMLSVAAYGGGIGTAGYLLQAKVAKEYLVRGSLHESLRVGRAMREGREQGRPVERILETTGGWLLFQGRATAVEWDSQEAYTFRYLNYYLEGEGAFAGQECRIWVKNEQHICWRDGLVVATSPDLIALVDPATGSPLTTRGDVTPGSAVAVVGVRTLDDAWRSEKGLELLGPRHFGFDIDYLPIEELAGT